MKFSFSATEKISILHGHVFVMVLFKRVAEHVTLCYTFYALSMRKFAMHLQLTGRINEPRREKTWFSGFRTRFDINRHVQSQKQARGLKLWL